MIRTIRSADWREAVDACQLLTSRLIICFDPGITSLLAPYLDQQLAYIRDDPNLAYV